MRRKSFLTLIVMVTAIGLMACKSNKSVETESSNETVETLQVNETSSEEIQEAESEELQNETADEWIESLELESPVFIIWNPQTVKKLVLEDNQEYQLTEGDQVLLAGYKGMNSFTCEPSIALEDIESFRQYLELSLNLEGKRTITLNMEFEDKECSITATFIEPTVVLTEGLEKYSAYEKMENDWPKGTIEEYIYTADNLYSHYVVKIDDIGNGAVEIIDGVETESEEIKINYNYVCDLPRTDFIGISGGTIGHNNIMMNVSCVDGNDYTYWMQENEITEVDFDEFIGYEKMNFWDYFRPISDYAEDGYSDVNIQENEIRVFIEGNFNGRQSYVGCLIDRERKKILKFEWISQEGGSISNEAISRFTNSLQIIDADYVEEY